MDMLDPTTDEKFRVRLQGPLFFIRPEPGILRVDSFFDVFDLATFLIHCIRIQRNVLADPSTDAVAIRITVQIVPVLIAHIATAVTGHLFDQLRRVFGNSIDFRHSPGKQLGGKSLRSRTTRNRRQSPRLAFGKENNQRDDKGDSCYQTAKFPKLKGFSVLQLR
jgi:hypothetical protein